MPTIVPKLSVWMITYNQEKYIEEALNSILMQKTNFEFEIVIGEDCSTDRTREILITYQKKYPDKIKLLLHEKNVGMVQNQHLTFNACQGKYIAMLEGDDFWINPNKLQIQYDTMQLYPQCDLCFHPVKNTNKQVLNNYSKEIKIFSMEETIVGGGYFVSTPSIMIKKSVIEKMPEFLESAPAGDYYIQIFGALNYGLLYLPYCMATYRVQANGSWSKSIKNIEVKQNFRENTLKYIIKVDDYLSKQYTIAFQKRYLHIALYLSMDYLYSGDSKKFKETIQKVKNYVIKKNKKFLVLYLFRKYPNFLKKTSRMYNNIKTYIKIYL